MPLTLLPRGSHSPEDINPTDMARIARELGTYQDQRRVELHAYQDLVNRYASMMQSRERMLIRAPWEAKAMHIMAQEVLLYANSTQIVKGKMAPKLIFIPEVTDRGMSDAILQIALAEEIEHAAVYWWTNDMFDTANAPKLPSHVLSSLVLPQKQMFMEFEEPLPIEITIEGTGDQTASLYWMYLRSEEDQLQLMLCYILEVHGEPQFVIDISGISYGTRFPEDDTVHRHNEIWATALKLLAFVNSPFVSVEGERVHRDIRKHIGPQVTTETARDPKINVVRLRHRTAAGLPPPSTADDATQGRKRGKNGHYWVSGHNRAQWYAKEKAHHVIWIAPFIKGDTSKPLMERIYKVAR